MKRTQDGRDYVVRLATEDLESTEATLKLLRDPQSQARIRNAERDIKQGRVLGEDAVRAMLTKRAEVE